MVTNKQINKINKKIDELCALVISGGLEIQGQLFLTENRKIKHKFTIE